MAKVADLIKQATKELQDAVKQIKDSDEDDLGNIAATFDDLADMADRNAAKFHKADQALSEEENDHETEDGNEEENPQDDASQPG